MKYFRYSREWKGSSPHDYYMYTVKWDWTNAAGFNYHLTVPCSDLVSGSIGTYAHITVSEVRSTGKRKRWSTLSDKVHWYVVLVAGAAGVAASYKPQDKNGAGLTLLSHQLLFFNKCVEDMKEIGCLPWVANWTEKWNGS